MYLPATKAAQWGLQVPKNLSLKILYAFRCILALTSYFVQAAELKTNIVWIFLTVHLFPQKDQVMITAVKQNCAQF